MDRYFTVKELLLMRLPGMPGTTAGWHQKINRDEWKYQLRGGRGGKAGGTREYVPPPSIMALIEAHERGVTLDAMTGRTAQRLAEGFELNVGKRLAEEFSGSTAAHLAAEMPYHVPTESPHAHLRAAEPEAHYHSRDYSRLRLAITLAEEAAAVQTLNIDQRVALILTFYNRLSKHPEK